ncbi:restriction endonuclease [Streptomyces sp. NPDC018584]|uniref:restriction endonuclease n=1 Tax=unclassified Streptomyces TaxID=2593676 RepID=UPI003792B4E1
MATYQPVRRRTRKTRRCGYRLPNLHWGWYVAAPIALYIAAKTWPVPVLGALISLAALLILKAVRPASLFSRLDRLRARRRALPRTNRTLARFQSMQPTRFERAIADLANEDDAVHSAIPQGGSNDRGADVLVHMRDGRRILIQCKRYTGTNKVTSDDVQKVNGTWRDIHGCDAAVIVTTTGFTRSAIDTNLMLRTRLRLVDGANLALWANGGPSPLA